MTETDRARFGEKIRQLRLARSLTQERLAHLAGLHPTYVGSIERGERNIGFDNVLKIARALGQPPSAPFEHFEQ